MGADNFAVVFAGVGIRHDDAAAFSASLSQRGSKLVMFRNLADDPVIGPALISVWSIQNESTIASVIGVKIERLKSNFPSSPILNAPPGT